MKTIDFTNTKCQEVIGDHPVLINTLIECGKQGHTVVFHNHDGRNVYIMCESCAWHNLKNRGGLEMVQKS